MIIKDNEDNIININNNFTINIILAACLRYCYDCYYYYINIFNKSQLK